MPLATPVKLKLRTDVRKRVDTVLVQRVRDAVDGAAGRDMDIADFEDQLEGRIQPVGSRWRNACTLNDPLTREAQLELLSLLNQALQRSPLWQVEAAEPGNDDAATRQEAWLVNKAAEYKLKKHLYDAAYNVTGANDTAVLYCGWKQSVRPERQTLYRELPGQSADFPPDADQEPDQGDVSDVDSDAPDGDDAPTSPPVPAEARDPNKQYTEEQVEFDAVAHDGCDLRIVDLADLYLYPANAQTIADAVGVLERIQYTEDQLLDGIDDFDFDRDQVMELIRRGPTHSANGEIRTARKDANEGVSGDVRQIEDGFYECFILFGRLPKLRDMDGVPSIPSRYMHDDSMAMLCPAHDIVFHLDISAYSDRPYIQFNILPKPKRFLGTGGCRLVASIQDEANANLQATIDATNLEMSPVMVTSQGWQSRYGNKFSIYPGANLPEDTESQQGLRILPWQRNSQLGMQLQEALVQRGKGLVAAQGYGQLDNKQRKNGEMQNVMSAADSKFDLYLTNFMFGVEELGARIVALHAQFGGDDFEEEFMGVKGVETITAQDLRGSFRYVPASTSNTSTPQMRLQIAQGILQVQQSYLGALMNTPPQYLPLLWHSHRQILIDMGCRKPEDYIGPEPQAPPTVPQQVQALVAQGMSPEQAIQMILGQAGQQNGALAAPGVPGAAGGAQGMIQGGGMQPTQSA